MNAIPRPAAPLALLLAAVLAVLGPVPDPATAAAKAGVPSPSVESNDARQDPASRIKAETERLRRAAKQADADLHGNGTDVKQEFERSLAQAQEALQAGRLYQSLEELAQARNLLVVLVGENRPPVSVGGLKDFEAAWKTTGIELAASERQARARLWAGAPAAIRAISEASQQKTMVLLEAGRAYVFGFGPQSGSYYLSAAKEAAAFATLCYDLKFPLHASRLLLHSLLADLRQLQARTAAAFQPPRSIELHAKFIRLNATLKFAGDLDGAQLYAGALYRYLDAVQQLGMLDAAPPDAAKESELRRAMGGWRARLTASQRDDSIAELFLQRAEALAAADRRPAPSQDDWMIAQVIVEQVLPSYLRALEAAPATPRSTPNAVTVTLVRWPYT